MNGTTREVVFGCGESTAMFQVQAGIEKQRALLEATCAVNSVKQRLDEVAAGERVCDVNDAWMLSRVLDQAQALLEACE